VVGYIIARVIENRETKRARDAMMMTLMMRRRKKKIQR